jgi:hypothetical protein
MGAASVNAAEESSLAGQAAQLRARAGAAPLSDDDLFVLALDEITRTTTYQERAYGTGSSCAT